MATQPTMHKSLAIPQVHAACMSERQVAEALWVSRADPLRRAVEAERYGPQTSKFVTYSPRISPNR